LLWCPLLHAAAGFLKALAELGKRMTVMLQQRSNPQHASMFSERQWADLAVFGGWALSMFGPVADLWPGEHDIISNSTFDHTRLSLPALAVAVMQVVTAVRAKAAESGGDRAAAAVAARAVRPVLTHSKNSTDALNAAIMSCVQIDTPPAPLKQFLRADNVAQLLIMDLAASTALLHTQQHGRPLSSSSSSGSSSSGSNSSSSNSGTV
jgi:uncharacterized membrane protein YgcG